MSWEDIYILYSPRFLQPNRIDDPIPPMLELGPNPEEDLFSIFPLDDLYYHLEPFTDKYQDAVDRDHFRQIEHYEPTNPFAIVPFDVPQKKKKDVAEPALEVKRLAEEMELNCRYTPLSLAGICKTSIDKIWWKPRGHFAKLKLHLERGYGWEKTSARIYVRDFLSSDM